MSKTIYVNIESGLDKVYRKAVALKTGETIHQGQWFVLSSGQAALCGDTGAATPIAYMALKDSGDPDVSDTLADGTVVSTGGMSGLVGLVEGTATTGAYNADGTFGAGKELTVENGKLTDAASGDWVFGYQTVAIGTDGLLHFVVNSGAALYLKA